MIMDETNFTDHDIIPDDELMSRISSKGLLVYYMKLAISGAHYKLSKYLIDKFKSSAEYDRELYSQLLYLSAQAGSTKLVKWLLNPKNNDAVIISDMLNYVDANGRNALHMTTNRLSDPVAIHNIVRKLVRHGINNVKDHQGLYPVDYTRGNKWVYERTVKYLTDHDYGNYFAIALSGGCKTKYVEHFNSHDAMRILIKLMSKDLFGKYQWSKIYQTVDYYHQLNLVDKLVEKIEFTDNVNILNLYYVIDDMSKDSVLYAALYTLLFKLTAEQQRVVLETSQSSKLLQQILLYNVSHCEKFCLIRDSYMFPNSI